MSASEPAAVNLEIAGGQTLTGTIVTKTAKNSAVALLAASLLNRGRTTLKNVPQIEEVNRLSEVLVSLGAQLNRAGNDLTITPPSRPRLENLDHEAAARTRSILLFLGPLLHHFAEFKLPHPGGCKLGERTVRPHLFALEKLGVKIASREDHYLVSGGGALRPAEIVMYESSDTATENVLLAASLIPGQTTIKFAPANYMVQELCHFLGQLGVEIAGIGTSTLVVHGVEKIDRTVEYALGEDPVEAMLFLALAATTGSALQIQRAPIDFLELELLKLEKMGFKFRLSAPYKSQNGFTKLVDITTAPSELVALEDKLHPLPFPGINIDNLPFFVPIATQAAGTTLIHDWVYENRAIYYWELSKLGAEIILADPHRVFIKGKTKLRATELVAPPALRPAALILIAMLAARGTSILRNIYSINRGYEDLAQRLQSLGAQIRVF